MLNAVKAALMGMAAIDSGAVTIRTVVASPVELIFGVSR